MDLLPHSSRNQSDARYPKYDVGMTTAPSSAIVHLVDSRAFQRLNSSVRLNMVPNAPAPNAV
jgi:hypothetical protein